MTERLEKMGELAERVAGVEVDASAVAERAAEREAVLDTVSEEEFRSEVKARRKERWNDWKARKLAGGENEVLAELGEEFGLGGVLSVPDRIVQEPLVKRHDRVDPRPLLRNDYGLTVGEEAYVAGLVDGRTQSEAYLAAFPNRASWSKAAVAADASRLFRQPHIKQRVKMIVDEATKKLVKESVWSREDAVFNLKLLVDSAREEMLRMFSAHEAQVDLFEREVAGIQEQLNAAVARVEAGEGTDKDVRKLTASLSERLHKMLAFQTRERIKKNTAEALGRSVEALNSMHGFNEVNVNLDSTVSFYGEDELED